MKIDKFRIGRTLISITTPQDTQIKIKETVDGGLNTYICVSDPRTVDYAYTHEDYREVMNHSLMNLPDGQPIMWAAWLWGIKGIERTMGPILFSDMINDTESGFKHFLLGDTDETLSAIVKKASANNDNIVGTLSPPFCSLDEFNYESIAQKVNDSGANIVWIAMRAPKQDFFAVKLLPYLDHKICIGVGAAFRFYLGEYKMAPPLIRKLGLMGLYWGKKNQKFVTFIWGYLTDNVPFLWLLFKITIWRLIGRKYYE